MKKISRKSKIISLGAISTIALAVIPAAVVACGSDSNSQSTITQQDINNYINKFNSSTSITGISTITTTKIPATISAADISNYFNDIPVIVGSGNSTPITLSFTTSNNNSNLGLIDLSVTASASGATSVSSITQSVKGFISVFTQNQTTVNNVIASLKTSNLSALSDKASTQASDVYTTLSANSSLTLADLSAYFDTSGITTAIGTTGVNLSYSLEPQTTELNSNGEIIVKINVSLGSAQGLVNQSVDLTIKGFATTPVSSTQTPNLNTLNTLSSTLSGLSLSAIQNDITPTTVYSDLIKNSSLSLSDFNAYFATTQINADITSASATATYTLIQPTTTNLENGTLNILVSLSLGSGDSAVVATTTLTINGFLTSIQNAVNTYLADINASTIIKGNSTILPSSLPTSSVNSSQYLINMPQLTSNQISLTYTFSNPKNEFGSVDVVISISAKGATTQTTKVIEIVGFLNSAQTAVNSYIAAVNANSSSITGSQNILASTLTKNTIASYLNGLPTNSNNIQLTYLISNVNNVTGSVTLEIIASNSGALSEASNSITISGFQTQSLGSLLATLTSSDFSTSNLNGNELGAISGTFNSLPSWITPTKGTSTELIPGLSFSDINQYNIEVNNAFGFAYLTLTGAGGTSSPKIVLSGLAGFSVNDNMTGIKFTAASSATIPSNLSKITTTSPTISNLTQLFNDLRINISDNTFMYQYVSAYQFSVAGNVVSVTLYFTNPSNNSVVSNTYTITGTFSPAATLSTLTASLAPGSVYANYWTKTSSNIDLSNSSASKSLYIPSPTVPGTFEFNSNATLATNGTTLPVFITNINWPSGYTNASVISWTMVGDNATGIATYTLNLTGGETATLSVSGFMTTTIATNLASFKLTLASNISSLATPTNGIVENTTQGLLNVGINTINWNNINYPLYTEGVSPYTIVNSNSTNGTTNFLITFSSGIVLSEPISGFATSSIAQLTFSAKTIIVPTDGVITLDQAQHLFNINGLTSSIQSDIKTITISNPSSSTTSVQLTIVNQTNQSTIFTISGYTTVLNQINKLVSLVSFQNNTGALIPIATAFPNNQNLVISATDILNGTSIPTWLVIPQSVKEGISQLVASGISKDTINLTISLKYTARYLPGLDSFNSSVYPQVQISVGKTNSSLIAVTSDIDVIFGTASQYLQNNIINLSLNNNYVNKITVNDFVTLLNKDGFMGQILPNGSYNGGFTGVVDLSKVASNSGVYNSTQQNLIRSFFNIGLKGTSLFRWTIFGTGTLNVFYALTNVVVQQQTNGILVRAYIGWNVYADVLIPNSNFLIPSVGQVITSNILSTIQNNIPNNQSLDVFTKNNNQPLTFTLNNLPSWINVTQAQINTILGSSGYTAENIDVTIGLPTYQYPPIQGVGTSYTSSNISISIKGVANSTSIGMIYSFDQAITLFQKITTISLTSDMTKLTFDQFMTQYGNAYISGTRPPIDTLNKMFNIKFASNWFSQWTIGNISYLAITPTNSAGVSTSIATATDISVMIYIQGNIHTTVIIPISSFAPATPTS